MNRRGFFRLAAGLLGLAKTGIGLGHTIPSEITVWFWQEKKVRIIYSENLTKGLRKEFADTYIKVYNANKIKMGPFYGEEFRQWI
jgi:hypothetical protein